MSDEEIKHQLPADQDGKGKELKLNIDPENPLEYNEHMAELFKEVGESNPKSIAEFLIRLNEINKLDADTSVKQ
jgi:hypothetical protein